MTIIAKTLATTFAVSVFLALAPLATVAQEASKMARVGVLITGKPTPTPPILKWLRKGLSDLGYEEGRNIVLEPRYTMRKRKRLKKLAKELVKLKVDVIVVTGARAAKMARKASSSIPIVVGSAGNLVGSGLVASLARPGGNITGNTAFSGELGAKQLQLLKEAIPGLARVAVLYSTATKNTTATFKQAKAAGPAMGLEIQNFGLGNESEFEGAFAAMTKARTGALIFVVSRLTSGYRKELIKLAAKRKIPTMCWRPSMARSGCFMSYGADRDAMYKHTATFVDKILKGAKPADLPVAQPTKFDLSVNLKTAKALGVTVPPTILLQANKVIK